MTYLGFLLYFVVPPIAALSVLNWYDSLRGRVLASPVNAWPAWSAVALLALIALTYTTPWDNYLVYAGVWGYPPEAVIGVIGWVPVEEYAFFVLQTLLTGSLLVWLGRRNGVVVDRLFTARPWLNRAGAGAVSVLWLGAILLVALAHTNAEFVRYKYLSLIVAWALPPLGIQAWYGADILWHYRRLYLFSLVPPSLYLCLADTAAIAAGTWEIRQYGKTGLHVWPNLPLEEFTFFFATNALLVSGMVLVLARETQARLPRVIRRTMQVIAGVQRPRLNTAAASFRKER